MSDWLEAERRMERAQQFSESQCWEEALEEIEAALAINPNNAAWHAQRGGLLEELDRFDEASEAFAHSHALDPGDPEISVVYGQSLVRLGRFSQALSMFEDIADRYPDFEPAYCFRINIYAELGRHEQAEQMFYLAQQLDDACPRCFMYMGISLMRRGQFDRAIFCYQRVLELDPECFSVNRRIAQAYRAQGQLERAKKYYLREMRDDPGNTDLLFEIADMSLEAGHTATASAKLNHILELDPDHLQANYALGKVELMQGRFEKALAYLESASALADETSRPLGLDTLLGETLFQLGRFSDARARLDKAIERQPDRMEAMLILGNCLLAMDKSREAADCFRRVIARDDSHALARLQLAVCLYRNHQYDVGLEHCREALRIKPDLFAAMTTASVGHIRLGQWGQARSMLKQALQHDPDNSDLQRLLKRLWWYRLKRGTKRILAWIGHHIT